VHTIEYFFGFHKPASLADIRQGASVFSSFGHVEAWGYTIDNTWWFFDPGRKSTKLLITHLHDEVEELLAHKFTLCREVLRVEKTNEFPIPFHLPMNCVTQCAGLVGLRAFSPNGFRRKLLRNNAEVIHGTEGRSRRQKSTVA